MALSQIVRRLPECRRRYDGFIVEEGNRSLQIWFGIGSRSVAGACEEAGTAVASGGSDFFTIVVDLDHGRCRDPKVNTSE